MLAAPNIEPEQMGGGSSAGISLSAVSVAAVRDGLLVNGPTSLNDPMSHLGGAFSSLLVGHSMRRGASQVDVRFCGIEPLSVKLKWNPLVDVAKGIRGSLPSSFAIKGLAA